MIDVCIAGAPAVDGRCGNPECVCAAFGEVISTYTRAEAIADGVLIDLGTFSFREGLTILQEAGFRYPVAISAAAFARAIAEPDAPLPPCQDLSGRMWDVVFMLSLACRMAAANPSELRFKVSVINWLRDSSYTKTIRETIQLKAICGPGDNAEPVITIMLPGED